MTGANTKHFGYVSWRRADRILARRPTPSTPAAGRRVSSTPVPAQSQGLQDVPFSGPFSGPPGGSGPHGAGRPVASVHFWGWGGEGGMSGGDEGGEELPGLVAVHRRAARRAGAGGAHQGGGAGGAEEHVAARAQARRAARVHADHALVPRGPGGPLRRALRGVEVLQRLVYLGGGGEPRVGAREGERAGTRADGSNSESGRRQ